MYIPGKFGKNLYIDELFPGGIKMNIGNMKNIVVLKDLPSNLIEEAIVILKENQTIKRPEYSEKKKVSRVEQKKIDNPKEYIVKEAEMVVSQYISNMEQKREKSSKTLINLAAKYKRLKIMTGGLLFVTIATIIIHLIS